MPLSLNPETVDFASDQIENGNFSTEQIWEDARPTADREQVYLENHSWKEFARWHLAIDVEQPGETRERYRYPVGDFDTIHRSSLVDAHRRATEAGQEEIASAANALLDQIDASS